MYGLDPGTGHIAGGDEESIKNTHQIMYGRVLGQHHLANICTRSYKPAFHIFTDTPRFIRIMDSADAQEIRLPVQMHYEQQKCVRMKGSLRNVGIFLH